MHRFNVRINLQKSPLNIVLLVSNNKSSVFNYPPFLQSAFRPADPAYTAHTHTRGNSIYEIVCIIAFAGGSVPFVFGRRADMLMRPDADATDSTVQCLGCFQLIPKSICLEARSRSRFRAIRNCCF